MVKHPSNYKNELQIQPHLHSSKKSIRRSSLVLPMATVTVTVVPVVPATVFGGTKRRTKRRRQRTKRRQGRKTKRR